jgi:ATP-dependent Clp protease protease subunit
MFDAVQQMLDIQIPDNTLPDPAMLSYYTFAAERKLFLEEDVGFPIMDMIKMIMRWNQEDKDVPVEQRKPIIIYIMSDGGYMCYMWAMLDAMLTSKTPIITVNLGVAASAASLIYLAGSKRYMMPTANVIIHEGSTELAGDANKVMDAIKNYDSELAKMKDFILSRSNIPRRMMNKRQKDDWYIDAKTCLEYGVCHKIVETLDEIM